MSVNTRIAMGAIAALVLTGCAEGAKESREDAAYDALDVWKEVAYYYVDYTDAPSVTFSDGYYNIEGKQIEARIKNPDLSFVTDGPSDWCVTIAYNNGSDAVSMGAEADISYSAGC